MIGRLADLITDASLTIPVIFSSPDDWPAHAASPCTSHTAAAHPPPRATPRRAAPPSPHLARVTSALRSVAVSAFARWACWAARGLAPVYVDALAMEAVLRASTLPPQWQEVVVDGGGASGGAAMLDAGEIRFSLPAEPTASTLAMLMRACSEVQRAGGGDISRVALAGFAHELHVRPPFHPLNTPFTDELLSCACALERTYAVL